MNNARRCSGVSASVLNTNTSRTGYSTSDDDDDDSCDDELSTSTMVLSSESLVLGVLLLLLLRYHDAERCNVDDDDEFATILLISYDANRMSVEANTSRCTIMMKFQRR
jgi:hypothetical protein